MEIRNNTPMYSRQSFGMAFKKVDGEDLAKFTDFVVDGAKNRGRALKGVRQLVKDQAANKHFDIEYDYKPNCSPSNRFVIVPTSEKAKAMYPSDVVAGKYYSNYTAACENVENEVAHAPRIFKPFVKLKGAFKKFIAKTYDMLDARYSAPSSMRVASRQATLQAKIVDAKIADEAAITKIFEQ